MDKSMRDYVCLVSGGTQGIGWAVVQALASEGAQVYGCGLSQQSLERAQQERVELPWAAQIHLAQCDVTRRQGYEAWIEGIYAETGRVDVLVNNAAYVRWVDVMEMSVEEAQLTMRVAYDGLVLGVKTVLPYMLHAGRGHIVSIGSIAGNIFVGGASAAYAAAKAAVDAYSQTLQVELQGTPVRVTLMRLGTVAGTDFFKRHVAPTRMPRLLDFLPYTTPPDVAAAVVDAIYRQRDVVTLPRYLALLRVLYVLAPRFSRWLAARGGSGQRDYAPVDWRYPPR